MATSSLGRFPSVPVTLLTAPLTQPSECVPHGHSQRGGLGAGRPGEGGSMAARVMTALHASVAPGVCVMPVGELVRSPGG